MGWEVDGSHSEICPVVSFGISGTELWVSLFEICLVVPSLEMDFHEVRKEINILYYQYIHRFLTNVA
jgi:hypothetical protein